MPVLKDVFKPILGGELFHNRCAWHVLNICVQDGLKMVEDIISPIRSAIYFICSSTARQQDFKRLCLENDMKSKHFPIDVPTGWNSTCHMLSSTFGYEKLLSAFYNEYIGSVNVTYLGEEDFNQAKTMVEILKQFEYATNLFSATYRPSSHVVLPRLSVIKVVFF
ncbi:hypothetical protein ACH5RR_006929 [Cinchona calisaya]|uniref:Transposase n=1 Tax=Cinchona calisaya TaxID=153742 RepID=A0ABD3AQD0_9GENT